MFYDALLGGDDEVGSSPVLDLNNVETEFIDSMDEVEMGMGELAIRKVSF